MPYMALSKLDYAEIIYEYLPESVYAFKYINFVMKFRYFMAAGCTKQHYLEFIMSYMTF